MFEVCCFDRESAIIVVEHCSGSGIVPRLELCARRDLDGITPDIADAKAVVEAAKQQMARHHKRTIIHVMVRPLPSHPLLGFIPLWQRSFVISDHARLARLLCGAAPFLWWHPGSGSETRPFDALVKDAQSLVEAGVDGFVFGYLRLVQSHAGAVGAIPIPADFPHRDDVLRYVTASANAGETNAGAAWIRLDVDWEALEAVAAIAKRPHKALNLTFHRAIDVLFQQYADYSDGADEMARIVEELVGRLSHLGNTVTILTSGGPAKAAHGVTTLTGLMKASAPHGCPPRARAIIMCAGGINPDNIVGLQSATLPTTGGYSWGFHGSLLGPDESHPSQEAIEKVLAAIKNPSRL